MRRDTLGFVNEDFSYPMVLSNSIAHREKNLNENIDYQNQNYVESSKNLPNNVYAMEFYSIKIKFNEKGLPQQIYVYCVLKSKLQLNL